MMKSKLVGIRIETHGFLLKQIKKIKTPDQNSKTSDIKIAYKKKPPKNQWFASSIHIYSTKYTLTELRGQVDLSGGYFGIQSSSFDISIRL